MSLRGSGLTGIAFYRLMPRPQLRWQPNVGDEVEVIRGSNDYERRFVGQTGKVTRKRGWGLFAVKFSNGQALNLRSVDLKKLPISTSGRPDEKAVTP